MLQQRQQAHPSLVPSLPEAWERGYHAALHVNIYPRSQALLEREYVQHNFNVCSLVPRLSRNAIMYLHACTTSMFAFWSMGARERSYNVRVPECGPGTEAITINHFIGY